LKRRRGFLIIVIAISLLAIAYFGFWVNRARPLISDGIVFEAYGGDDFFARLFPRWQTKAVDINGRGDAPPKMLEQDMPSEMEWSPDGQWIVFSTSSENARAGGNSEIYVVKADGNSAPILLTNNPENDISPTWSPDGTQIVYDASRPNEMSGLYLLDIACILRAGMCNVQPRLFLKGGNNPRWSPDGKQIAYLTLRSGDPVFVTNADGTGEPRGIGPVNCVRPQWSPDGKRLTLECKDGIYLVNADGSDLVHLLPNGGYVRWSPNGEWLAFVGGKSFDPNLGNQVGEGGLETPALRSNAIFLINIDGTNLRRLTQDNYQFIGPYRWLPSTSASP
jgi:dipeptidyl aminopeptidase/acylaminoacyl peptidase